MNLLKNSTREREQHQRWRVVDFRPWRSLRGLLFALVCLALAPALCVALYTGVQSRRLLIDQAMHHVQTSEIASSSSNSVTYLSPAVATAFSESPQIEKADAMMRETVLGALSIAVLVLWITRFMSNMFILKPAAALVKMARQVGSGNFEAHVHEVPNWGELGLVARSFEHMAHDLARRTANDKEQLQALHEYAERNKALLNATTDSVLLLGAHGVVQALNEQAAKKRGLKTEELLGKSIFDYYPSEILEGRKKAIHQVFSTGTPLFFEEHIGDHWVWVTFYPVCDVQGHVVQLASYARDVSQHKQAERALRQAEERYRLLIEHAPVGIYQSESEPCGHYVQVNHHFARIFGYSSPESVLEAIHDIASQVYVDPEQRKQLHNLVCKDGAALDFESENIRNDGTIFWTTRNVRAKPLPNSDRILFEGFISDITDRKLAENRLKHQASHDDLTGLANRSYFLSKMRSMMEQASLDAIPFAVLFLDLDNFKLINDSFGHPVGDALIHRFSARLETLLSENVTVARFGGDEFGILVSSVIDLFAALSLAKSVHLLLKRPFRLGECDVTLTASIGLVLYSVGYLTPEDILRDADIAMYRAKHRGKGLTEVFDKDMRLDLIRRVRLEQGLRRAVSSGEIIVLYQPYFDLKTLSLAGFEALVRWKRDDGNIVSPVEFIPVAEESGSILEIGPFVLQTACNQMVEWLHFFGNQFPFTMSVNVSGREIFQGDPVGQIRQALVSSGLPAHRLRIEVTESVLMDDLEVGKEVLEAARAQGVSIALDDFGTGYSSLGYLRSLPLDLIKIDRSFVQNLDRPGRDKDIVRSIVDLAHGLDLEVVAEGIENESMLGVLAQANCDYGQGFLMARPLDKDSAFTLISRCHNLSNAVE